MLFFSAVSPRSQIFKTEGVPREGSEGSSEIEFVFPSPAVRSSRDFSCNFRVHGRCPEPAGQWTWGSRIHIKAHTMPKTHSRAAVTDKAGRHKFARCHFTPPYRRAADLLEPENSSGGEPWRQAVPNSVHRPAFALANPVGKRVERGGWRVGRPGQSQRPERETSPAPALRFHPAVTAQSPWPAGSTGRCFPTSRRWRAHATRCASRSSGS